MSRSAVDHDDGGMGAAIGREAIASQYNELS
jgi:hypothetical protein